jgi:hypothetical protein
MHVPLGGPTLSQSILAANPSLISALSLGEEWSNKLQHFGGDEKYPVIQFQLIKFWRYQVEVYEQEASQHLAFQWENRSIRVCLQVSQPQFSRFVCRTSV